LPLHFKEFVSVTASHLSHRAWNKGYHWHAQISFISWPTFWNWL